MDWMSWSFLFWAGFWVVIAGAVGVMVYIIFSLLRSNRNAEDAEGKEDDDTDTTPTPVDTTQDATPATSGNRGWVPTGIAVVAILVAVFGMFRPNLEPLEKSNVALKARQDSLAMYLREVAAVADYADSVASQATLDVKNINGILNDGYQINGENTRYTGVLNQLVVLGKAAKETATRIEQLSTQTRSNRAYTEQVERNAVRTLALAMGDTTMEYAQGVWQTAVSAKTGDLADSVFAEAAIATPLQGAVGLNTQAISSLLSERVSFDDFRRVADTVDSTTVALAEVSSATRATAVILQDYGNKKIDRRAVAVKAAEVLAELE